MNHDAGLDTDTGATLDTLVDGVASETVPATDRGLRYGDGLFETLRVAGGVPVWWDAHLARLARGCAVLDLACPPEALLQDECARLCRGRDGTLRLLLTRGDGVGGYAAATGAPRRVLMFAPAPAPAPRPLVVGWSALRLAIQPRLAGIKHLNRLEQVLAAQECARAGLDECLLLDSAEAVSCGVSTNLFIVRGGRLQTPLLDRCGIAGTCREWILAHAQCEETRITRAEVEQADELFLCNSVRGILPVGRLGTRALPAAPVTRGLMQALGRAEPALATDMRIDG